MRHASRVGIVAAVGLLCVACFSPNRNADTDNASSSGTEASGESTTADSTTDSASSGPATTTDNPTATDPTATATTPTATNPTATDPTATATDPTDATTDGTTTTGTDSDTEHPVVECDVWLQNCPRGEKCNPWADDGGTAINAARCVPIDDFPQGVDEPCAVEGDHPSGFDNCDLGLLCSGAYSDGMGVCVPLCHGNPKSPMCDDPGNSCVVLNSGALPLCLTNCDPLTQNCPGDDSCQPVGSNFLCSPVAVDGANGDECTATNECGLGLTCINGELLDNCDSGAGCCSPFCDTSDPSCPAGMMCQAWFEEGSVPPGLENTGVCTN